MGKPSSVVLSVFIVAACLVGCKTPEQSASWDGCKDLIKQGLFEDEGVARPVAKTRAGRFLGKPDSEARLRCRGAIKFPDGADGEKIDYTATPWVDWSNYWAAGDASTLAKEKWPWSSRPWRITGPNSRGVNGSLIDLEYERMELVKFNLFDNYTWETYVRGAQGKHGSAFSVWEEMRLPEDHPQYAAVGGDDEQLCKGDLIRARNLTGICNDLRNPLMGSTNTVFARNMPFETTFPDNGRN